MNHEQLKAIFVAVCAVWTIVYVATFVYFILKQD